MVIVAGVQGTLRTSLLYNPGIQQMRQFIQQAPSACQAQPAFTPVH